MRQLWILFAALTCTSAIVYRTTEQRSDYSYDKDDEITSESLNTGEFMPLKEAHEEDGYEENVGESGYKFEVPEEEKFGKSWEVNGEEHSTEKPKSQPITRYPDPYVSARNASVPPSTSYGVPFYYKTYSRPLMKFKSVPVVRKVPILFQKVRTTQPYYTKAIRPKYSAMYGGAASKFKLNNFGKRYKTYEDMYENSNYGTKDYYHVSRKPIGNVYYMNGHEWVQQYPPKSNIIGLSFSKSNSMGLPVYNPARYEVYNYPKLSAYEEKNKPVFPRIRDSFLYRDFKDDPGNGFFFTMNQKHNPERGESYLYEVPLRYKALLFSGNGRKHRRSMQVSQQEPAASPGLYKSSNFDTAKWLQVGSHFRQNPDYFGSSDYGSSGNNMYLQLQ